MGSGRVETWRGGERAGEWPFAGGLSLDRRCLSPTHRSVSTSRSSNRTCGFPASGSRTRFHAFAHG